MTWTVRIYNDETASTYTDHEAADQTGAYALVFNEPAPLPEICTPVNPDVHWVNVYENGICIYTTFNLDMLGSPL